MNYYIIDNGQQCGPFSVEQLRMRGITGETQVWCSGMPQWTNAQNVPELRPYIKPIAQSPYYHDQKYRATPTSHRPGNNNIAIAIGATIISFIFCNIIGLAFGIVSIIFASKVDRLWKANDFNEAENSAEKAKTWGIVSFITTFVVIVIWISMFFMGVSFLNDLYYDLFYDNYYDYDYYY